MAPHRNESERIALGRRYSSRRALCSNHDPGIGARVGVGTSDKVMSNPSAGALGLQLHRDCARKPMIFFRSSLDERPPYGFMLLPGTTSSGLAIKRSSFSSFQTKPASFMALEKP